MSRTIQNQDICTMKILLAAATIFEVQPTLDKSVYFQNIDLQFVITGIGILSSTYQLQKAVGLFKPDLVLQVGIAGCFDSNLPLGMVLAIKDEAHGDLGVEEKGVFRDVFDLSLVKTDAAPFQNKRLNNPHLERFNLLAWPTVSSVTVNEISTRTDRIEQLVQQYGAVVESMEGAALHYVCLQENIPFLQIRSLSNYIGERDKRKWQLVQAITNLNNALQAWLEKVNG